MHSDLPYLREIFVFLSAAIILVPLFRRLKLNAILGYLIVGIVIGPYGIYEFFPNLPFENFLSITEYEYVKPIAELGVVFLLFTIGLELSFHRLWSLRRLIFGLGTSQVVVTTIAIALLLKFTHLNIYATILIGASLALSSSAVVTKLLFDNREFATSVGQTSFAILLLQDLAVVPLLIFIGVLSTTTSGTELSKFLLIGFFEALLIILLILILGRLILRPVYRYVANAHSAELFTALTLLVVIATSVITGETGMSMALGAFLSGLVLGETEYRHQIIADMEPFKGLLLGLFFMSVGMGINLAAIAGDFEWVIAAVIGLFLIKALLLTVLGLVFKLNLALALRTGIMLGQAGEFAFVLMGVAFTKGIISSQTYNFVLMVTSLSLLFAPLQYSLGHKLTKKLSKPTNDILTDEHISVSDHVIIAGFGRVGKMIAKILKAQNIPYIGVDYSTDVTNKMRKEDFAVYFGDARKENVLRHLNASNASALLVSMNDPHSSLDTVRNARRVFSDLKIFARAIDPNHAAQLKKEGANIVILETVEMSLQLGDRILQEYSIPLEIIEESLAEARHKECKINI